MCIKHLFVISGGPGSGKTTVLRELDRLGYQTEPEVARQIIQEQVEAGGTALPWSDRETYTDLMLERSIASYVRHASGLEPTFFDRGIPDTLGYARLIGLPGSERIWQVCQRYRYAPVIFLAPPWREIYETGSERKQDFEEAVKTFVVLREVYECLGYEVVELPKVPAAARAEFIVARLGLSE